MKARLANGVMLKKQQQHRGRDEDMGPTSEVPCVTGSGRGVKGHTLSTKLGIWQTCDILVVALGSRVQPSIEACGAGSVIQRSPPALVADSYHPACFTMLRLMC